MTIFKEYSHKDLLISCSIDSANLLEYYIRSCLYNGLEGHELQKKWTIIIWDFSTEIKINKHVLLDNCTWLNVALTGIAGLFSKFIFFLVRGAIIQNDGARSFVIGNTVLVNIMLIMTIVCLTNLQMDDLFIDNC